MPFSKQAFALAGIVTGVFGIGTATAAIPVPDVQPIDYVAGSPETRSIPFIAWPDDLAEHGYVEAEYLLSGTANTYQYVSPDGPSAAVEVATSDIPYATRMLVRRPADGEAFNGTVVLEILNATAQYDGAPMWDIMHKTIIEQNAAWVGITYDDLAADFLRNKWGTTASPAPANAAPRDNSRYADINIPSWSLTWDMLMQAAALLKSDDPANPFAAQLVERIIPGGYSQSASLVKTLANSFHEVAINDGNHLFDGYYSGDGGSVGRLLVAGQGKVLSPDDIRNMYNLDAPVLVFFNQPGGASGATAENTPPQELMRIYQYAGGSHVDQELFTTGGRLSLNHFGVGATEPDCGLPLNPLPISHVMGALLIVLDEWIRDGTPPPDSILIDRAADGRVAVDTDGNAISGVRHPAIEVPLGTYLRENIYPPGVVVFDPSTWNGWQPVVCPIFGGYDAFNQEELERRYPFRDDYIASVEREVSRAIADRFLTPEDGAWLIAQAEASGIGAADNEVKSSGSSSAMGFALLGGLLLLRLLSAWLRNRLLMGKNQV